ncbi:hypothetical protein B0J18DRAFT_181897 [Chaetomium sp. MPI-SDFR-AT-0129]|nr:hypothetical protein B0J18DRAFT_181897 [Chaetomium sp. MPI-SDFR-AT-0129]
MANLFFFSLFLVLFVLGLSSFGMHALFGDWAVLAICLFFLSSFWFLVLFIITSIFFSISHCLGIYSFMPFSGRRGVWLVSIFAFIFSGRGNRGTEVQRYGGYRGETHRLLVVVVAYTHMVFRLFEKLFLFLFVLLEVSLLFSRF